MRHGDRGCLGCCGASWVSGRLGRLAYIWQSPAAEGREFAEGREERGQLTFELGARVCACACLYVLGARGHRPPAGSICLPLALHTKCIQT